MIFQLIIRYMKKNQKRTKAAILGIMGTMIVLTAVNTFAGTFLGVIRKNIMDEEGSYHAVFHELNSDQYEELKKSNQIQLCMPVTECAEHEQGELFCVQVEMKKVNRGIFRVTQKLAKEIGMPRQPEEMRELLPNRKNAKYNVSYHMELLEYYGVDELEQIGAGTLVNAVYIMLALMGCVLIYNAYAISVFEKLKYLGTLGSIGASKYQKALVVYGEGILEGIIGIPIGIGIGLGLSKAVVWIIQRALLYDESLLLEITPGTLGKLVLTGIVMVFLACFFPAGKAVKTSSMDLIAHQYFIGKGIQNRTDLMKKHKVLGTAGTLTLKNIWVRRKSYFLNILLLIATFCMLLDGIAAMRGINGDYYPKDDRGRPELQLWMELYTTDEKKIQECCERIRELPEVKNISLERTLDLEGILLEKEQLQKDLDEFAVQDFVFFKNCRADIKDSSGKEMEGYWFHPYIIGLDDNTFQKYVEKAGYSIPDNAEYPILIEDYIEVKTDDGIQRRSVLQAEPGSKFSFLYSRYGDMNSLVKNQVDEIKKGQFYLIGTTEEAPPYPYFSGIQDDINGYQQKISGILHIYMSMSNFEKLLADEEYKDTYGKHPVDTAAYNYTPYKSIPTYIKFDIYREKNGSISLLDRIFKNKGLSVRIKEDKEAEQLISQIAAEIGLKKGTAESWEYFTYGSHLPENETYCFNSQAIWQKNQYFHSEKSLLLILGYGVIALITVLSLTNIIQNISMGMRVRKREFAVYQSMGMSFGVLKKMLIIENAMYGLVGCFIGIPISFLFLYEVYHEFNRGYRIVWKMPWELVPIQLAMGLLLIFIPVIHTVKQMKHLNIIESIRDENM